MIVKSDNPPYVLHCPQCGCRRFEVQGPVLGGTTVYCSGCGAEAGELDDLLMIIEERAGKCEGMWLTHLCH